MGPLRSFSLPDKVWIGADSVHALVTKPQSNTKETSLKLLYNRLTLQKIFTVHLQKSAEAVVQKSTPRGRKKWRPSNPNPERP